MRLTDNMITGNYMRSLNRNLKDLSDLNTKVAAGRRFMKMSENPASAVKAFGLRKDLNRMEMYTSSLSDSQALLDEAENSLSIINNMATEALAKISQATNGTLNDTDRATMAGALRGYQEMILGAEQDPAAVDPGPVSPIPALGLAGRGRSPALLETGRLLPGRGHPPAA